MPLYLHIWCECGRTGKIETELRDNHHAIFRKARCSVCRSHGLPGRPASAVLGWGSDFDWMVQRKRKQARPSTQNLDQSGA